MAPPELATAGILVGSTDQSNLPCVLSCLIQVVAMGQRLVYHNHRREDVSDFTLRVVPRSNTLAPFVGRSSVCCPVSVPLVTTPSFAQATRAEICIPEQTGTLQFRSILRIRQIPGGVVMVGYRRAIAAACCRRKDYLVGPQVVENHWEDVVRALQRYGCVCLISGFCREMMTLFDRGYSAGVTYHKWK